MPIPEPPLNAPAGRGGAPSIPPGTALFSGFRALHHRNFRLFFLGQMVSLVGTWMQNTAQAWLVWRLSHSEWALGLLGFAQLGPVLLLGLVGGLAADRFDRRGLVLTTQTVALVQSVALAALTLAGSIQVWQVLALAGLMGLVNAFDMPARQAFLVRMVGREDLGNAIALNSSLFNGARIAGPALAGFLVAWWGEGACFTVNAVSFLAVLGGLLAMRFPEEDLRGVTAGAARDLVEGLRYAWETPSVRRLLALVLGTSLFAVPFSVLLPAYAGDVLGKGPSALGLLMSSAGVGSLLGAVIMAYRKGMAGLDGLAGVGAACFGAAVAAFGWSGSFVLSSLFLAAAGFAMITQMAATNTRLQDLVPDRLRGRVVSLYVVTFVGVAPLGGLLQGRLAQSLGVQPVLVLGGLATVILAVIYLAFCRRAGCLGRDTAAAP